MKFILLLLLPVFSYAQFYKFEPGEKFTIKESRWMKLSDTEGRALKPSCILLGISEIEVIQQFNESVLFKVLSNRDNKQLACQPGTLVQSNDVLAHSLKTKSEIYWKRKNKILKMLKGEHKYTSLNGVHLGDYYSLSTWQWAVVEQEKTIDGEFFWETKVCRLLPRGSMKVVGLLAEEEQVLLEYNMPLVRDHKECPDKTIFAKALKEFN